MPRNETISILDGSTFVVSDTHGDVEAGPDQVHGLFYRDTRFLSRWILTVDGHRPDVLSVENGKYFEAQFFLVPPTGTVNANPTVSILRKRLIGDGFHEDITAFNHGDEPKDVEIRLEAGADYADLFEVKDGLESQASRAAGAARTPSPRPL
jgi:glycogen debranching enzyme